MSVYVICFGCVSYIFIIFLCIFWICVPLRFVFRRFRRWAVSFFVLLLGSKVRTWGEIRRLLKSRPSRQIPGQASTVQLFVRKNKQNSIIQIIQSISKIFKDIQSTHSLFKLLIPLDLFIYFAHLYISLHIFISDLAPLDSFGLLWTSFWPWQVARPTKREELLRRELIEGRVPDVEEGIGQLAKICLRFCSWNLDHFGITFLIFLSCIPLMRRAEIISALL